MVVGESSALPADLSRQLADTFRAFRLSARLNLRLFQAGPCRLTSGGFFSRLLASFPSEIALLADLAPKPPMQPQVHVNDVHK